MDEGLYVVDNEISQLLAWCRGNEHAARMLASIGVLTQVADDIVDGDAKDPVEAMARVLSLSLVDLQLNPFFIANRHHLIPLIATSIQFWAQSDAWGRSGSKETQMYGYVYRELMEQVITMTAYIIGGNEYARQVTKEVNAFYHTKGQDKFKAWVAEVQNV